MANIILTTDCQKNCEFCFAKTDKHKNLKFTFDNFIEAVKFITTGQRVINLLGGEPTLHEDFDKMLEYLLINDYMVQVFTNGLLSSEKFDSIIKVLNKIVLRKEQLIFSVNIDKDKDKTQEIFLDNINNLSYPSFTICDPNTNLLFLNELIYKYNLDPTIRLGIAFPVIGGNNKFLPIESYRKVAKNIIELANNSEGVTIKFDCGFPLCMFNLEEIAELSKNKENDFVFVCGQPLDIYPDLTISNCFPLSNLHRAHMSKFSNLKEATDYFYKGFSTPVGIYGKKCMECNFFRNVCSGGCKGFYKPDKDGDTEWKQLNGTTNGI